MRALPVALLLLAVPVALAAMACENPEGNQPPAAPTASPYGAYPPPGYPPGYAPGQPPPGYAPPAQPPPGYTAQPQYAPPQPTYAPPQPTYAPPQPTAPPPGPAPTVAAPAGSGAMATPGPLALPCQSDMVCGLHHCNTQYGKCAFPCQTAADCVAPNTCNTALGGVCTPQMPGAH